MLMKEVEIGSIVKLIKMYVNIPDSQIFKTPSFSGGSSVF